MADEEPSSSSKGGKAKAYNVSLRVTGEVVRVVE